MATQQALEEQRQYPDFSKCGRCERPWPCVTNHPTQYNENHGCFPLCQTCWEELGTPETRMPFYRVMWERWKYDSPGHEGSWEEIEEAVINGG